MLTGDLRGQATTTYGPSLSAPQPPLMQYVPPAGTQGAAQGAVQGALPAYGQQNQQQFLGAPTMTAPPAGQEVYEPEPSPLMDDTMGFQGDGAMPAVAGEPGFTMPQQVNAQILNVCFCINANGDKLYSNISLTSDQFNINNAQFVPKQGTMCGGFNIYGGIEPGEATCDTFIAPQEY